MLKYSHLNLPTDVYFGNGQRQTIEYHGNGVKKSVKYSQTTAAIMGGNLPDDDSERIEMIDYAPKDIQPNRLL